MNWADALGWNDCMVRLLIHVEGETEETFVNEILAPHLCRRGYSKVSARLVGNARQRDRRGGIRAWNAVSKDIVNHLKEDPTCLATTMVDYYALPQSGGRAWPGREAAGAMPFEQKAAAVESALLADICRELGNRFDTRRFIPFVIMHEFEGLLFSDCQSFSRGIGRPDLAVEFQAIRDQFPLGPEEINDSPETAPSKRVKKLVEGYEKPLLGSLAVLEIGLEAIRTECPHFNAWLTHLEDWLR
ncbi:MAG: DUF4276 family protein [Deltaproteobacteria bacterium]